jgi:DNA polymerase II large subunit
MGGTGATSVAMSPEQKAYFERLEADAGKILELAKKARKAGLDPSLTVEIPLAPDLAARVEEQVQIKGVAERVRELSKQYSSRELVALHCAKEVATGKFGAWPSKEQALDKAVRTGLSILTEGILVAPLEGIAKVLIGRNNDNTDYVDLYFAGPIRAAGGTAQAMSVLIADVVRRELGVGRYIATQAEIERYKEEVPAYKRAQHLQYAPEGDEIEHIVRQCPVCINGEGTEQEEVTGHRDLPRVEGNRLRGGAVLVLAEGLTQKAPKIMKVVSALKVPEWDFLERFIKKAPEQTKEKPDEIEEIEASDKFIKELIGGRPVFSHPSRPGGFRLRYGRSRTGGLASTSISPVAMHVVDDFLAIGTQMKLERPGKGTICTPCSELEPPILLLRNGDLVQPATIEQWRALASPVAQIVDLGEILIPFGEFLENNALLPDASFTIEWWLAELRQAAGDEIAKQWLLRKPDFADAVQIAHTHKVPLHPDHNLFWHDVTWDEYTGLSYALESATFDHGILCVPKGLGVKNSLVTLGVLHRETPTHYEVRERAHGLLAGLGLASDGENLRPTSQRDPVLAVPAVGKNPVLAAVSRLTGVTVKARAPTRIGARMGRPEKADKRAMSPPVHVLFPIGQDGGSQRDIEAASQKGTTRVKVGIRRCPSCGREAYMVRCTCGTRTEPTGSPPQERDFPVREEFTQALGRLRGVRRPDKLKGVEGLISAPKTPEPLEKGILRALHDVWVFKDGTLRFDCTDAPVTHVRPSEIGTSVAKLIALGYPVDTHGGPLERPDQVIELRIQDVVLPKSGGEYFVRAAQYVDDLLERFYGLPPFYLVKEPADLVGHLVAGLAPHTSGAVLGRVIGFTKANVGYAHPFYHAAKRRNCDGDEDAFMLLLDAFLNFSRAFVPDRRGGLMDLPLVLATRIDPSEIDKEALNVDVGWSYPLELYRASEQHLAAKEIAKKIDIVGHRVGTPRQFEGFGFTLDSASIHEGPLDSSYKTLGSMPDKMAAQLELADKLRGVDAADVAARVISHHLLPDLIGNLKAFAKQSVRCTKCSTKYRRMPVTGKCTKLLANGKDLCGNPVSLTVHQASVRKYLDLCIQLSEKYKIPDYTKEHIRLVQQFIDDTFRMRDMKLAAFG